MKFELTVTSANQVVTDRVRHYLTPHLIVEHNSSGRLVNYLHKDRLGSTVAITSGSVDVKLDEKRSFDPFGKPRDEFYGDTVAGRLQSNLNDRGFTGHEHLDDVELIHMNGRGYDYNLGRFLSVDPYIQYPENSQSINPYSYILNNPMAGVDPTGYRSSLFRSDDWVTTYNLSTSNTKQINQKSNGVNHQQGDTGTSQSLLVQVGKEFWENADEYGKLILTEAVKQLVKHSPQAFADVSGYSSAQDLVTALETGEVDDLGWVVVGAITSRFGGRVFSNTIRRNPCNKSCFVAGTMVLTDKGYVPIESIGEGDKVLATDIHTGEQSWKPVTHTWVVFDKDIYEVQIKANDGTYQTVEATDSHPFYVVNKGWVGTINLTLGDKFINEQGEHYLVTGLRSLDRKDIAYNFTVQDFHTYYVTEKNILVHNCGEKLTESNKGRSDVTKYSLDDFAQVGNKISQKQMRHIGGRKEYRGGGFLDSLEDAQKVLDNFNSGAANIIGKSKQGFPIIKVDGVTGTNVANVASGTYKQATNIFMVKGTKSPSIVLMNPNWSPK